MTGRALVALCAAAAVLGAVGCDFVSTLGSPGPLDPRRPRQQMLGGVASHAAITTCGSCHRQLATAGGDMSRRCVHCHAELESDRVALGHCTGCHGEHEGPAPYLAQRTGPGPVHHRAQTGGARVATAPTVPTTPNTHAPEPRRAPGPPDRP